MTTFKSIWIHLESDEKQALADSLSTSKQYLSQIAYRHRQPSADMIRRLVASDPRLHAEMFL